MKLFCLFLVQIDSKKEKNVILFRILAIKR